MLAGIYDITLYDIFIIASFYGNWPMRSGSCCSYPAFYPASLQVIRFFILLYFGLSIHLCTIPT